MGDEADFRRKFSEASWPIMHPGTREAFVSFESEDVGLVQLVRFMTSSGASADGTWSGAEWTWLVLDDGDERDHRH